MQLHLSGFARQVFRWLAVCVVAIALTFSLSRSAEAEPSSIDITVYRDPSCRCCGGWMEHLRAEGFEPKNVPTEDMEAFKQQHGITESIASCHTAIVDGYLIEGHVPVADIKRLLAERSQIAGIAVPGMPIGTPGMESDDQQHDPFTVFSFDSQGSTAVFSEYSP